MMRVLTLFRNATETGQILRFAMQVSRLRDYVAPRLAVTAVCGDSTDDTCDEVARTLTTFGIEHEVVEFSHGVPEMGSTEAPVRIKAVSLAQDVALARVRGNDETVVYVDSDLLWSADVPVLLERRLLTEPAYGVLAPLVLVDGRFYDTWGFRAQGKRFTDLPPYHPAIDWHGGVTPLDSAGGMLVMRGEAARFALCSGTSMLGLCASVQKRGAGIGLVAGLSVRHPSTPTADGEFV